MSSPAMTTMASTPVLALRHGTKSFLGFNALTDVTCELRAGAVHCLIGDNGAGKSTMVQILSGLAQPTSGTIELEGEVTMFRSPADALAKGIATVYQEQPILPLMSVARNFFLGVEPRKQFGPISWFDSRHANEACMAELSSLGLRRVQDGRQLAGTLSGGEREALVIARAVFLGAKVLILDEPTAALGVKEAGLVLRLVAAARGRGIATMLITHNANHAMSIGDEFTVLIHGQVADHFYRGERSQLQLLELMAGGEQLDFLTEP